MEAAKLKKKLHGVIRPTSANECQNHSIDCPKVGDSGAKKKTKERGRRKRGAAKRGKKKGLKMHDTEKGD